MVTNSSPRRPLVQILIILFFLVSLTATVVAWLITANASERRLKENFFLDSNNTISWINTRIETYINLLSGVQVSVEINPGVTRTEWDGYINRTKILEKYPGLRSINYVQKVPFTNKDSFIKEVLKENSNDPPYQSYSIRAIDSNYVKDQKDFYPVVYTTGKLDDRFRALGFDLSSEKKRAEALFTARDNAQLTLTPLIRFVINPTNNGFSLILPLYQKELPLETVKQLQQAFIGAIYAPFDVNQFFDSILKPNGQDAFPNLDLEVYDFQSEDYLYDKDQSISLLRDNNRYAITAKQTLSFANRRWEIVTGIPKKFITDPKWAPPSFIIIVSGLLASLATFFYLQKQLRHENTPS